MKKIAVCVGTDLVGNVRVRLSLLYVDDGSGDVISERFHSVNLEPGCDAAAARQAVEAHLAMPAEDSGIPGGPWPAIPNDAWDDVMAHCAVVQKPAVVAAYRAKVEAAEQKLQAKRDQAAREAAARLEG